MKNLPKFQVPSSVEEARLAQDRLRSKLQIKDDFDNIDLIVGVDCGYDIKNNLAHASLVTMKIDELKPIEQVQAFAPAEFPYVPGFLAFREIPAILAALAKLKSIPDLLMVDGQGIAHPRRIGIATHLGLLLDMPALGVAKSRLTGQFSNPGFSKGDTSPLTDKGEQIGYVLRSRDKTNPLFVSPGHRISMETSIDITLQCLTRYRLPEPTRMADKFSKLKKPDEASPLLI